MQQSKYLLGKAQCSDLNKQGSMLYLDLGSKPVPRYGGLGFLSTWIKHILPAKTYENIPTKGALCVLEQDENFNQIGVHLHDPNGLSSEALWIVPDFNLWKELVDYVT